MHAKTKILLLDVEYLKELRMRWIFNSFKVLFIIGKWMKSQQFDLFGLSITALFALISFYEQLNSVTTIIIFVILIFTMILYTYSASFILSTRVNLASQELLKHLSEINSARMIKRKIRSTPPLRFFIGILFYVNVGRQCWRILIF